MATGSVTDITNRLYGLLPAGWFPPLGQAPVLNALLTGIATQLSFIYSLYAYAKLQTRIATATNAFLDLIAWDFFGNLLARYTSDTDTTFRTRIQAFLMMPRLTRAGIKAMLTTLTGRTPAIYAEWNPQDCGGWSDGKTGSIIGWSVSGCWGLRVPNQLSIIAYRPAGETGVPNQAGWSVAGPLYAGDTIFGPPGQFALGQLRTTLNPSPGGWDDGTGTVGGAISWVSATSIDGNVPDSLIEAYVADWVAAGLNYQLSISN